MTFNIINIIIVITTIILSALCISAMRNVNHIFPVQKITCKSNLRTSADIFALPRKNALLRDIGKDLKNMHADHTQVRKALILLYVV